MSTQNLIAYDANGTAIVVADGAELLVYAAEDGAPLWRQALESKIVGVGTTADEVVALDQNGKLFWWDAETGEENDRVEVEGDEFSALALDPDGVAAVLVDGTLQVVEPGEEPRAVELPRACSLAWSGDGGLLAVGSKDGKVWVLDEQDLKVDEPSVLGATVTGIAWNANGCWLVTGGDRVFELDEAGAKQKLLARLDGSELALLACSEDGDTFALRRDPGTVEALSWPAGETIGTVRYQDRKVTGVALGPKPWLGVGLDLGDANKISLRTESVHRTKTFEGRAHSSWMLSVSVKGVEARRKRSQRGALSAEAAPKPKLPRTEAELNAPDWQTLGMLGIIAVATVLMWSIAYLPIPGIGESCNAHPPDSKKANKIATTEDLAAKPKGAAIEAIQRWTSHDLAGARELIKGQALVELTQAIQECERNRPVCDSRKKDLEGKVVTMGEVLKREGTSTRVRVITQVTGSEPVKYLVDVEPEGKLFKVARRTLES
jgi:hypothetical protein